jgi:hypothetical protein
VKLTIDNQDGAGPVDYTSSISGTAPLQITRTLNAPSICTLALAGCGPALPVPARNGRMVVTGSLGEYLFTGYLAVEPAMEYTGAGISGPVYRALVSAVSDEYLLDNCFCRRRTARRSSRSPPSSVR